jgi:Zn-dependent peptidase ImmA (M78 family)
MSNTQLVEQVREFLAWVKPRLGIHGAVNVLLLQQDIVNGKQKSFGSFNTQTQQIRVTVKDRHILDVLRSLAHELVHLHQHQQNKLMAADGQTGSEQENEANAVAGVLLRDWNRTDRQS